MCNLTSCSILPSLVICALNGDRCCQPTFVRLTKHCAFETCHVHTLRRAWCLIRGERAVPMRGLQCTTVMLEHDAWREHRSNSSEPSATHILKYTLLLTKVRYVELDDERTRTERARRPVDQGDTIHLVRVWSQHKNHIPTLRPALVADRRAFMIEVRPPPSPTPRPYCSVHHDQTRIRNCCCLSTYQVRPTVSPVSKRCSPDVTINFFPVYAIEILLHLR
jgi:hypothetical protein